MRYGRHLSASTDRSAMGMTARPRDDGRCGRWCIRLRELVSGQQYGGDQQDEAGHNGKNARAGLPRCEPTAMSFNA